MDGSRQRFVAQWLIGDATGVWLSSKKTPPAQSQRGQNPSRHQAISTPLFFNTAVSVVDRVTPSSQMVCMTFPVPEPSTSITIFVLLAVALPGSVCPVVTVTHWDKTEVDVYRPFAHLLCLGFYPSSQTPPPPNLCCLPPRP